MKRGYIAVVAAAVLLIPTATVLLVIQSQSSPAKADETKEVKDVKDDEGTVTTKSGLKYLDRKVGDGAIAKAGDTVFVHYTGTLTDGKKFDSSLDRGKPIDFRLGTRQVIAGWDEGIAGMKIGGKRKLMIPYLLAYGAAGKPPVIPAKADLIFEVELVDVR